METLGVQIAQVLALVLTVGTLFLSMIGAALLWLSRTLKTQAHQLVYVPVEGRRQQVYEDAMDREPYGCREPCHSHTPTTLRSRAVLRTRPRV